MILYVIMNLVRFCDLDGTLIHSHRIEMENGVLVERYKEKPLSYMDNKVYERLQNVPKESFIPVTSRTIEQYQRISLYRDGGIPEYALLDNGGVLLVNEEEDIQWRQEMKQYMSAELAMYNDIIAEAGVFGETKLQDDLVIFIKPYTEEKRRLLEEFIQKCDGIQTFQHRNKVYVCSGRLTKGYAIKKFMNKYGISDSVVAGDSEIDLTMLEYGSFGFFPFELKRIIDTKYLCKVSFVEKLDLADSILNYEM